MISYVLNKSVHVFGSIHETTSRSCQPPAMPVIHEETEKDVEWENFQVMSLTGKHRPTVMPVIPEETDEDIALWVPFEFPSASPQQSVLPTAVPVV